MSYLHIIPFGVSAAADGAFEPLALFQCRNRVLDLMLLKVSLLRKRFWTMLTLEGPHALVHAHVVEQIPSLGKVFVATWVLANIRNLAFVGKGVILSHFLIFVRLQHFIIHILLREVWVLLA